MTNLQVRIAVCNDCVNEIYGYIPPQTNPEYNDCYLCDKYTDKWVDHNIEGLLSHLMYKLKSLKRNQMEFLQIPEPFFTQIKSGTKIYEARPYDKKYKLFDTLKTINEHGETMNCIVVGLIRADTISELIDKVSLNLILPGVTTKDKGIEILKQWGSDDGVVGIKLVPVNICMEKGCKENRTDEAFCDEHGKMIY